MNESVYTHSARFDTAVALTEEELFRLAPSIFAEQAHESRSERFRPIATIEVLRALQNEGFMPVGVRQSRTKDEGRRPYTKHLIRMRRLDDDLKYSVGDTAMEILLRNANDGTSVWELMAGLFRVRCMNSLVALLSTLESIKVRHSGDVAANVIDGVFRVMESAELALEAPKVWSGIELSPIEQIELAQKAHAVRFADTAGAINTPIQPYQLLDRRREADSGNDLWTIFNIVQENAIKGGLHNIGRVANGAIRAVTTRQIKGVDADVKINRALWSIGAEAAREKIAA